MQHLLRSSCVFFLVLAAGSVTAAPPPQAARPADPPGVRKVGDTTYEIGSLRVDTAKREVNVPATLNGVRVLEFVANAKGGGKAYESALTLDVDPITFNTALLLIGLDPTRGRPPKEVFDPAPAAGDPIEIFVSWGSRQVRVEELLYDERTKNTVPVGRWVYTGSTFVDTGDGRQKYAAELDGVLIGFMHSPSSIIERVDALVGYGATVTNPTLGLEAGASVTLMIRALPRPAAKR